MFTRVATFGAVGLNIRDYNQVILLSFPDCEPLSAVIGQTVTGLRLVCGFGYCLWQWNVIRLCARATIKGFVAV